jgi:hypothetical protein
MFWFLRRVNRKNAPTRRAAAMKWRDHDYDVELRREINVDRLASISESELDEADETGFLAGTGMFQHLSGFNCSDLVEAICKERQLIHRLQQAPDLESATEPHEYMYKSCRIAVVHARKDSKSDPDDASELRRLHAAADITQALARFCIEAEFKISDWRFDGT